MADEAEQVIFSFDLTESWKTIKKYSNLYCCFFYADFGDQCQGTFGFN